MKKKTNTGAFLRMQDRHPIAMIALLIVFCPPVGLYLMWSKNCEWLSWVKAAVSVVLAVAIALAIILIPDPPKPETEGNVEIIVKKENKRAFGPFKPEGVPEMAQLLKNYEQGSTLISEPTATPEPIRVYCNDNGLYYHYAECRYVYDTTPRVTLAQALNAGKTACKDCKPPSELTY